MTHYIPRSATLASAAVVLALGAYACSSNTPTSAPSVAPTIVVTPTPQPATPKIVPTFTPWATLPPTPVPTAPPSSAPHVNPTPLPGKTSAPGVCVGTASNVSFLTTAAKNLNFTVYCATKLASGWGFSSSPQSSWAGGSAGHIFVYYRYRTTSTRLDVCEGSFSSSYCPGAKTYLGTGKFGSMSGKLYSTSDGYALLVSPGTSRAYTLIGHYIPKATFTAIAAAMMAVPK